MNVKYKIKRLLCFLIGHHYMLHVGSYFGFPNEPISAWTTCKRCGKMKGRIASPQIPPI